MAKTAKAQQKPAKKSAKKRTSKTAASKVRQTEEASRADKARFEYRVWGEHRKARKALRKMADTETRERVDDCYLLVDDPTWNAKVRDDTLKVKQLVSERKGFERWVSAKHRSSKSAPSPFDDLYDDLDFDRLRSKKKYTIAKALKKLDPDSGIRPLFVSKKRRRYTVGELRAEVTDIEILDTGEVLRTLSIEGDDLADLVKLRKALGLKGETNTAVHTAIDPG